MKHLVVLGLAAALLVSCGGGSQTTGTRDGGGHGGALDGGVDGGAPDGGPGDSLTSVNPATGPLAGGTPVEVRGGGFVQGIQVDFGGVPCTGLVVVSGTRLSCNTPAHGTAEAVEVLATWPDATTASLPGAFTYVSTTTIGFAGIEVPGTDPTLAPGDPLTVSAEVYVAGVTPGPGQGSGITAEAGFGPATADPSANPSAFTFTALSYTGDHDGLKPGDLANDVYGASLTGPATTGSYRLAVRFSLDGKTWTYADRSGTTAGTPFSASDLPTVTVKPKAAPAVGFAQILAPATDPTVAGGGMVTVSSQVYVSGVTDGPGQGGGVVAEAGFGPAAADPSADPTKFTFTALAYTGDHDGITPGDMANDAYGASIAAPTAAGSYHLAVRFSTDAKQTWTYADRTGTDAGSPFKASDLPTVTVSATGTVAIDYCELHFPSTLLGAPDQDTGLVYGWVYTKGVTDQAGQGAGITAQLGVGKTGTDPASDPSWTFADAAYNTDKGNNDEYMAKIAAPTTPGSYDYAYRFSGDGGKTWTDCDLPGVNGAPGGSTNGYSAGDAGKLTVMTPTIDYCELHWPPTASQTLGQAGPTVYGDVYKQGVTDAGGQGPYIEAALGVGPHGSDPTKATTTGWTWTTATYQGKSPASANNDEYQADLPAQAKAGTYDYAFRFRVQGAATWTYCDLPSSNGSADGYQPAGAGVLTVK